jgi:hypothetical protein
MTYEDLLAARDSEGEKCKKKPYTTSREAVDLRNKMTRRGKIEARVYKCSRCGKYHITTTRYWTEKLLKPQINTRVTGYDIEMINKNT